MASVNGALSAVVSSIKTDSRSCGGCGKEMRGSAVCCGSCGLRQSGIMGKIMGRYFLIRKCLVLATLSVVLTAVVVKAWGIVFPTPTPEGILLLAKDASLLLGLVLVAVKIWGFISPTPKGLLRRAQIAHRVAQSAAATAKVTSTVWDCWDSRAVANKKIAKYHRLRDRLSEEVKASLPEMSYVTSY